MKFYKHVTRGYVSSISSQSGEESDGNISREEFETISAKCQNCPCAPEGYGYRLIDISYDWELYEMPPKPPEDEATIEDYEEALSQLGVKEESL